jgi:hypothetical protein
LHLTALAVSTHLIADEEVPGCRPSSMVIRAEPPIVIVRAGASEGYIVPYHKA